MASPLGKLCQMGDRAYTSKPDQRQSEKALLHSSSNGGMAGAGDRKKDLTLL
ncbi:MAG: hypothetical protein HC895_23500 [Leptolyngbyaceae cyanobacterium SM1_3_5]|nr:hypothetical protein [Leptolyngbyaceae cyanobacterium SM1_3_5]